MAGGTGECMIQYRKVALFLDQISSEALTLQSLLLSYIFLFGKHFFQIYLFINYLFFDSLLKAWWFQLLF